MLKTGEDGGAKFVLFSLALRTMPVWDVVNDWCEAGTRGRDFTERKLTRSVFAGDMGRFVPGIATATNVPAGENSPRLAFD